MRTPKTLKNKLFSASCLLLFASSQTTFATETRTSAVASPAPLALQVKSGAALVVDETDFSVLYAQQEDAVLPIASITKLMTALVVLDGSQSMEEMVTITNADRDTELNSGSRLNIGAKLSRGEMLHLALMASENRAAHALGRTYPGGLPAFLAAMNAKARSLGMTSTHFADPTGLSALNVSNARDLVRLVVAASRDPLIRHYSTDQKYVARVGKRPLEFHNTNLLVTQPDWDIALQKTGYTRAAGRCLVMKTLIEGKSVVIVLLNSLGTQTRIADARRIRKWMEAGAEAAQLAVQSAL
jgi:D-alanyl-D-alanine endopeptidase (penicillin-binding protein 7)